MNVHYVVRHTGQFTANNTIDAPGGGGRLVHDGSRPWAVLRVNENGHMTYCASRHATQGAARGVVTKRNAKLDKLNGRVF